MALDPQAHRARLRCNVARIDEIFADCLGEAEAAMSADGVEAWLDGADRVCRLGRGTELVLIFLEEMPRVVRLTDESVLSETAAMAEHLSRSACGPAINPFLGTLPLVARRLESAEMLREWFRLVERMAAEAPDGLPPLLAQAGHLLGQLTIGGLANWVGFGLRAYRGQPHRFPDFFALQTADAHAALQRERHGTLFVDNERRLKLYLRAFWGLESPFKPYSLAFDQERKPVPHLDRLGLHLPDVMDDLDGVAGLDRYRAAIAHMAAHKRWSEPFFADNFSVFQHLSVETFEDARVETLAIGEHPGLRRLWLSLHPLPRQGACPEGWSCIRHKLAMLSRALLDPHHAYTDPALLDYADRFRRRMAADPFDQKLSADLGVSWLKDLYEHGFRRPQVWFEDTIVSYRDDNRYIWRFLEDVKSEDHFHSDHGAHDRSGPNEDGLLPPRHYPEWDQSLRNYRPDWTTVFESIQAPGDPLRIDDLLERHRLLAKQLRKLVDRLKPQQRKRVRQQTEGDEIDLDLAIRARVDLLTGTSPDERLYQRNEHGGRDISALLLLDLSESINDVPEGCDRSILRLSQEAVSLLAWATDALGDPFAVAGFSSDTRHDVRYVHFKGFREPWGADSKARLAAMGAGRSTRMGAALRHAVGHLEGRREERKLLLILSDGEPSDVDVDDPRHLRWDAHAAVCEARAKGVTPFCITLDSKADDYIADIFGANYAVIDRIERLPERLSRLFMALTK